MFIVVEGLDGTGKSTLANSLAAELGGIALREPDGPYRALLKHPKVPPKDHQQLFEKSHSVTVYGVVAAQSYGIPVVCDRWQPISYHAYQVFGEGAPIQVGFTGEVIPDVVFYLDAPFQQLFERMSEGDYYEKRPAEYFVRVKQGYEAFLSELYCPVCRLDASVSAPAVLNEALWYLNSNKLI